jgi:hypothetical protein
MDSIIINIHVSVMSTTLVIPATTLRLLWVAAPPLSVSRSGTENLGRKAAHPLAGWVREQRLWANT